MKYIVYVLVSKKDRNLYIGQTNNLEDRLLRHNKGLVESTKRRIPLELIYTERYSTRSEAMAREKQLKTASGKKQLKRSLKIWQFPR